MRERNKIIMEYGTYMLHTLPVILLPLRDCICCQERF